MEPTGKIKVLHVINSLACGGIQRQMINLVKALPQDRFESSIISFDDRIFFDGLENITVKTLSRSPFFALTAPFQTARFINSLKPDIIHVWNIFALPVIYAAWPFLKIKPALINGVLREAPLRMPLPKKLISLTFNFHKCVVANSESSLASFGQTGKKGRHIIYNGFDSSTLSTLSKQEASERLGFPIDKTKAAMIASLSELKDHETFIKAAKLCIEKTDDMIFYIVGDGPMRQNLESLVQSLSMENKVIFTGFRKDTAAILRAVDISVLLSPPSHSEGFPNSILESLANGIPSVATNSGGSAELIKNGQNGFLIPSSSPEALRDRLLELKNSPSLYDKMALNARVSANRFSNDNMANEFAVLYKVLYS